MTLPGTDTRQETRSALIGFASLLGSSVVGALGFILIASNRWQLFDPAIAVFIILFVQWQTLGLTVSKLGVEQTVFALVSERNGINLDTGGYLLRSVLPLSALFALAVLYVFSPWCAAVAFLSVILDSASLILMAEFNARGFFRVTTVGNLLNYPLFFLLLFALNPVVTMNQDWALALFLLTSTARWCWLRQNRRQAAGETVTIACTTAMGVQQALNYLLFRFDQVLLALLGLKTQFGETVALYVFLAKFPELAAGVLVIAGTVAFPKRYLHYPVEYGALWQGTRRNAARIAGYLLSCGVAALLYTRVWKGAAIPWLLVLPFLLHALLILPANNLTYSMLRQGYLGGLVRKLAWSGAAGAALVLLLGAARDLTALPWLIPAQLLAFILQGLCLGWGKQRVLYV
jgi:hypothetical protein